MRRVPRMTGGPQPKGEWRKKVQPVFIEMMEQFKRNNPLSRSPLKEDRKKSQEWAKNAETEFRMKGREVGEQFRREGIVLHDFAGKILDLDLEDPAVKNSPMNNSCFLGSVGTNSGKHGVNCNMKEMRESGRRASKYWRS